jgi:hypothetical protein
MCVGLARTIYIYIYIYKHTYTYTHTVKYRACVHILARYTVHSPYKHISRQFYLCALSECVCVSVSVRVSECV